MYNALKIIKHSVAEQETVEIGIVQNPIKIARQHVKNVVDFATFGILSSPREEPDIYVKVPGRTTFSNCVVDGRMEMFDPMKPDVVKKYEITQDGRRYRGICPVHDNGDGTFECCVDCMDYVTEAKL